MRFLLLMLLVGFTSADAVDEAKHLNLSDAVGLSGYDPVSYFGDKPVKGDEKWSFEKGAGERYHFDSKANLEAFKAYPEKFLPAYGGWCAYAMLDGDKVEVDPMTYKIVEGKLYLFYNGFWGDTLKKWNKKLNKSKEAALINQADQEWQQIVEVSD
ncbi:MAG: YHS domain-containing protein [Candidatus Pelagisphaera sp.]|jgi:YHS domain-containing protein